MKDLNKIFLKQLNSVKHKRIIFWGASVFLKEFLKQYDLEKYKILGIVDMNPQKWGQKLGKYEIFSEEKINDLNPDCIIISIKNMTTSSNKSLVKHIKSKHSNLKILPNVLSARSFKLLYLYKNIIWIFDSIIPKNKKKIVFFSYPDFSDNAREYYEYLKERHSGEYELIWVYDNLNNESYDLIKNKYYIASFKAILHIITSKYLVFTHPNFLSDIFNIKSHLLLQLWHGMPLKTLGFVEKGINKDLLKHYKNSGQLGHFFVTSDIFKLSMISSFLMNPNRIFITGQPRTDCILKCRNKEKVAKFINKQEYDKVILYTPTYKEVIRNNRQDVGSGFKNIFYCDDYSETEFYKMLEEKNILFILKPHPFDEPFYRNYVCKGNLNHKNIKVVYENDMKENGLYFYEFFQHADLMITDFSSIAIDYLITKKPVIFLNSTINEYSKNRGFILDDNYEILMAGAKVNSFRKLMDQINDSLTVDSFREERLKKLPLLLKYTDSDASKRIYEIMKDL